MSDEHVELRRRTMGEQVQWLVTEVAVLRAEVNMMQRQAVPVELPGDVLFNPDHVHRLMAGLELMREEGRYLAPRVITALEELHRAERRRTDA